MKIQIPKRVGLEFLWFDKVSMNRHLKELNTSYKTFEATSQEMSQLQERLALAYEDIGQQLSKYFDVE